MRQIKQPVHKRSILESQVFKGRRETATAKNIAIKTGFMGACVHI